MQSHLSYLRRTSSKCMWMETLGSLNFTKKSQRLQSRSILARTFHCTNRIVAKIATQTYLHVNHFLKFGNFFIINRFLNIIRFLFKDDHSRVKLSCDEFDESGGYINANYVDVSFLD